MREVLLVAVGGMAGTVSRHLVNVLAARVLGSGLPYGTLIVNVVGCFLLGVILQAGRESAVFTGTYRLLLAVGFMGAFTTFSTLCYEVTSYLKTGTWVTAAGLLAAHMILGLLATFGGWTMGRAAVN